LSVLARGGSTIFRSWHHSVRDHRTGVLILPGDGVVAAVLLAKSKAENSGWIVITFGWGMAVMVGVYLRVLLRRAPQPAITLGFLDPRDDQRLAGVEYFVGEMIGAMIGAFLGLPHLLPALARHRGSWVEAGGVLHRPGDPQLRVGTWSPRSSAHSCWYSESWRSSLRGSE